MKMFTGEIRGNEVEFFFSDSTKYHISILENTFNKFEPVQLFSNWRILIRCINELINIPTELKDRNLIIDFMSMNIDLFVEENKESFNRMCDILQSKFEGDVYLRFRNLIKMTCAINKANMSVSRGIQLNINTVKDAIDYFQSRRYYYETVQSLIPHLSNGQEKVNFNDLLNVFQYTIDSCMINITTSYYSRLCNRCLIDYSVRNDGEEVIGNYLFNHLEGFYFEPERLSLIDQLELRRDIVGNINSIGKVANKIFSFSEVADSMELFNSAFEKYKLDEFPVYHELNSLFVDVAPFLIDDYDIIIDESSFMIISNKYSQIKLVGNDSDYYSIVNENYPFDKFEGDYYSTVVSLMRFLYRTLTNSLGKNKSFTINSGFVFEEKVKELLDKYGFISTGIKRINKKEFDIITIKNNKVYNFQCKNSFIDITRIRTNINLAARINQNLIRYFKRALLKEENREKLIIQETGIDTIYHFVVSRFPIISRNENIISFNCLEQRLQTLEKCTSLTDSLA